MEWSGSFSGSPDGKWANERKSKFEFFFAKKYGRPLSDLEYADIVNEFRRLLKANYYPHIKPLPGALDIIKYVRSEFDLLFVSSSMPDSEIKELVEMNGFSGYFDFVLMGLRI